VGSLTLALALAATAAVLFDDGKNVGIGTTTPRHRLSIAGGPTWTANGWKGAIELENASAIAWQTNAGNQRAGIGHTNGVLAFFRTTSDPGTAGSPAVYDLAIADSGNVGIGTLSPAHKLDVAGNINYGQLAKLDVADNFAAVIRSADLLLGHSSRRGAPGRALVDWSREELVLNFGRDWTRASVGSDLNVNGTLGVTGAITGSGAITTTGTLTSTGLTSHGPIHMKTAGFVGQTPLCHSAGGTSLGAIALCSSSLRYKTDVESFQGGLGVIERLHPISFTWKQGGARDIGLGAEEVERVEPRLTFRNDAGEIEGVKYSQLSAVFINAFKQQQAQIETQQRQIAAQQGEIEELKRIVCATHPEAEMCRAQWAAEHPL
jgi:hypothetical protein